jgi:hypothetical protein
MYCVILESLLLQIRIECVSKHVHINMDATMIADNHEWIVNNDEWEFGIKIINMTKVLEYRAKTTTTKYFWTQLYIKWQRFHEFDDLLLNPIKKSKVHDPGRRQDFHSVLYKASYKTNWHNANP